MAAMAVISSERHVLLLRIHFLLIREGGNVIKFSRFSIMVMSLGFCVALIGCQKQGADQVKPKTDASKSDKGTSAGAKVDSAIEKTKEKAQEVGSATKEKTQELTSKAKEKTQDVGAGTKNDAKGK